MLIKQLISDIYDIANFVPVDEIEVEIGSGEQLEIKEVFWDDIEGILKIKTY
jgi:hypothetical protein